VSGPADAGTVARLVALEDAAAAVLALDAALLTPEQVQVLESAEAVAYFMRDRFERPGYWA